MIGNWNYGTGLTRFTSAVHVDLDVEGGVDGGQHEGLTHHHDRSLATEIVFDTAVLLSGESDRKRSVE